MPAGVRFRAQLELEAASRVNNLAPREAPGLPAAEPVCCCGLGFGRARCTRGACTQPEAVTQRQQPERRHGAGVGHGASHGMLAVTV